jgi:CRISPR-associated protein Csb1
LFRNGPTGRAITESQSRDAAAVFHHSPHTLVFGGWDSTGPRGGLGAKYERAITSEIVAYDIAVGRKTASRIDPTGIQRQAGPLYAAPDGTWTLDPAEARQENDKPVLLGGANARERGRPSQANHGNVVPTVDRDPATATGEPASGGVTARTILGTTVLSFIQLRRLRFPTLPDGSAVTGNQQGEIEVAARTALAALGVAAAALAFEDGFDLRSRCVLVARGPLEFEVVARDGSAYQFELTSADALTLVAEAAERTAAAGLAWRSGELLLRPSTRLVELIRRSHDLAAGGSEDGA